MSDSRQLRLIAGTLITLAAVVWVVLQRPAEGPTMPVSRPDHALNSGGSSNDLQAAADAPLSQAGSVVIDKSGGNAPAAADKVPSQVQELLKRPSGLIRIEDVPLLDAETEARLIERYHATTGVTDRLSIIRVLSLGGSAPSVALFTNAILREFSGYRTTTKEENAAILGMPGCLGLLARREDGALKFLMAAVRRDFDLSSGLWYQPDGALASVCTLRGRCFTGLGRCGRPEAQAFFDDLRNDPVGAADFLEQENDSFVMDAAFFLYCWGSPSVLSHLQSGDRLDGDQILAAYRTWRYSTPDGAAWQSWYKEILAERWRRKNAQHARGDIPTSSEPAPPPKPEP